MLFVSLSTNKGFFILQIRKFQYREAVLSASKALSIDTYHPSANYYYGLANLHLGNTTDAKDGFDIAAASVEFRSSAYTALSKIYFRENDLAKAAELQHATIPSLEDEMELWEGTEDAEIGEGDVEGEDPAP